MIVAIDPKVDYAFKRLFGRQQNQDLLVDLINAVLQEPAERRVVGLEILNPFQDKDFLEDKLSVLDIKARDQSGRQFNIEMQMLAFAAFRPRVLYYWARLHQSQLEEGADYGVLRPTLTICFVNSVLFPELPGWQGIFELREREQGVRFSEQLLIHVLELPKFVCRVEELQTPLERWLYFLRHGEELDPDHLPATLQDPVIKRAVEELRMMSQSELERERYEARLKWQRDVSTALAEARREGEVKGRAEGEARGRAEGEAKGRTEGLVQQAQLCQRLLGQPMTPTEALRQLPLSELEQRVRELEAELTSRRGS